MADQIFDMFGHPVVEGRRSRGRPVHQVTVEKRNRVSMLVAFGWSDDRIANALGLCKKTLFKHYFHEMERRLKARDMLDAKRLEHLWALAIEGNVAAHREFGRLLEKTDADNAERFFRGDDDDDEIVAKTSKLGKKEAAALAAKAVEQDDDWGTDLAFRGGRLDS